MDSGCCWIGVNPWFRVISVGVVSKWLRGLGSKIQAFEYVALLRKCPPYLALLRLGEHRETVRQHRRLRQRSVCDREKDQEEDGRSEGVHVARGVVSY